MCWTCNFMSSVNLTKCFSHLPHQVFLDFTGKGGDKHKKSAVWMSLLKAALQMTISSTLLGRVHNRVFLKKYGVLAQVWWFLLIWVIGQVFTSH